MIESVASYCSYIYSSIKKHFKATAASVQYTHCELPISLDMEASNQLDRL